MLTRLEIDNYRCFEGFVWEPARKQLILGANGCGKSSMMDALTNLRRFVAGDAKVDELFPLRERTKWLDRAEQRFSLHVEIDKVPYCYRLVIGAAGDPVKPVVQSETLDCGNGALCVSFEKGQVTVGRLAPEFSYGLDGSRSAISSLGESAAAALAIRFRRWMRTVCFFRLNPFTIDSRAESDDADPKPDLSNFAAWYRSLYQSYPKRAQALFKSLEETLDGFDSMALQDAAEGVRLLNVLFKSGWTERFLSNDLPNKTTSIGRLTQAMMPLSFRFNELSEGQRCLICLYSILHFVLVEGRTAIIDEPENFVSLRELQPWLKAASRMVSEADGQLILISHNPELIDQWAPRHGIRFVRDGAGPVKVEPWHGDAESGLSPAQLIARGWDDA
jgi:energy-coupling factor transporter ATP-binding protein EcfA2